MSSLFKNIAISYSNFYLIFSLLTNNYVSSSYNSIIGSIFFFIFIFNGLLISLVVLIDFDNADYHFVLSNSVSAIK